MAEGPRYLRGFDSDTLSRHHVNRVRRAVDLEPLKIDRTKTARSARRAPRRRGRPWWVFPLAALLVLAAVAWVFEARIRETIERLRSPTVRVYLVERSSPAAAAATRGTAASGYVIAARRAALSADFSGRVVELRVREGSRVHEGEVVARLYDEEFRAAARRAEANVVTALTEVSRAETELESAKLDLPPLQDAIEATEGDRDAARSALELAHLQWKRIAELQGQGASTVEELDRARTDRDRSEAILRATEARLERARNELASGRRRVTNAEAAWQVQVAQVESAQATLRESLATLEKTTIRAPFAGTVILKDAEIGEVVSPFSQGGSNARGSVVTLVDFDSLEVQADIQETTLPLVIRGAPAHVFLDAYPEKRYLGRVDRIWPTANRQKGTVEVRVKFNEPDALLKPELAVRVIFDPEVDDPAGAEVPTPSILIPREALVARDGNPGVFVYENRVVRFRAVTTGETIGRRVQIQSGLEPGEEIVFDPPANLEEGQRVQVQRDE